MTLFRHPTPSRRMVAAGLVAAPLALAGRPARSAERLTIRVGYAAIGVDNRPYSEGTSAATARAANTLEDVFKDDPGIKVEWFFFKGAGPAVNEA
ncbi:MAG: nitrate ABC transporter substrate-binding protein, partial [Phreatobacter sp.]